MHKVIKAIAQVQNCRGQFNGPSSTVILCMPNEQKNQKSLRQKEFLDTVKDLLRPPRGGGFLFLDTPEGDFLERGTF